MLFSHVLRFPRSASCHDRFFVNSNRTLVRYSVFQFHNTSIFKCSALIVTFRTHLFTLQCFFYCHSHFIRKINGHCITDHLVAVIHTFIDKLEIIRKALNSCNLSDCHTAIEMFFALYKAAIVLSKLHHLRSLWVKLTLPSRCLYRKRLLVP